MNNNNSNLFKVTILGNYLGCKFPKGTSVEFICDNKQSSLRQPIRLYQIPQLEKAAKDAFYRKYGFYDDHLGGYDVKLENLTEQSRKIQTNNVSIKTITYAIILFIVIAIAFKFCGSGIVKTEDKQEQQIESEHIKHNRTSKKVIRKKKFQESKDIQKLETVKDIQSNTENIINEEPQAVDQTTDLPASEQNVEEIVF